jgi:exopolysaccharide production protein ExoQ
MALWIPLLWILIIGSRPVSAWFGAGIPVEKIDDYLEGSALDRNIFFILIVAGLVVLLRRRLDWGNIIRSNSWLCTFFLYCGISLIWSDYPLVGFKRWIKDIGNVIMVLLVLTEGDPVSAIEAVFARYTYLVIPLSVIFIKYFPEIGRYYNQWTWTSAYCGVTLEKNSLGPVIFICALFLVWDLIHLRRTGERKTDTADLLGRIVLLLMMFWMITITNSSTSSLCLIIGVGILVCLRYPFTRRQARHLGKYSLVLGTLILIIISIPGILETFVTVMERDITLGRADLWADLLKAPINPLLGTGYQSFWLGPFAEHMWEKYYFHPNQAHNGFLELYLNLGLVGVCLFIAVIISTGKRLKRGLLLGNNYAILRFSFFVIVLFSNWTEATFNRLSLVWILMIIATLTYPRLPKSMPKNMVHSLNSGTNRALPKGQFNLPASSRQLLNSNGCVT